MIELTGFEIFIFSFEFLSAFVLINFFHEVGHAVKLSKYLNKKVKIKFNNSFKGFEVGEEKDYETLTTKQLKDIYFNGVAYGFYVLIFFAIIEPLISLLFIIPYTFSCRYDFDNLKRLSKN